MSEAVQEILQRIQQLPEADRLLLEARLDQLAAERQAVSLPRLTPGELRKLPREQQDAILAAAAAMAEEDYRSDKELTGFEAFGEEEWEDDAR